MLKFLHNFTITRLEKNINLYVQFYSRWSHRRPVKVLSPEEFENQEKENCKNALNGKLNDIETQQKSVNSSTNFKINWKHPMSSSSSNNIQKEKEEEEIVQNTINKNFTPQKKQKTHLIKQKTFETDMLETVIDKEGNFVYTRMKDHDPRVGMLLTEIKSRKEKNKSLILLEGKRLIKDALLAGCIPKYILFSRITEIEYLKSYLPKMCCLKLYKMPYREIQMWSDLSTTPGIMGVFKTPDVSIFEPVHSIPLTIICDNIRDPGNLGTALRICAGVGCSKVFLLKGCVDLWDTKVLRSGAGAHFRLRIENNCEWENVKKHFKNDSKVFLADNRLVSVENSNRTELLSEKLSMLPICPYYTIDFKIAKHIYLIIGGETYGISDESYMYSSETGNAVRLNVPLYNNVESLNVSTALAVIAFEIKKQFSS